MDLKRVVVTGLGALTPLGNNVDEFKKALFEGVSGADTITRFDPSDFKTKFACELKGYDPLNYFDRKDARKLDPYAQYAIISSDEAIKDAKLDPETLDVDRVGVMMSSGIGGLYTFENEVISFVENDYKPRFNPFFIPKMIGDIASGHISMKYGFRGPNYGTVAACATATIALANAFDHIRLGRAKVMVVGGCEASITRVGVGGFNAMHALSTRNDDPKTASRPFDIGRDGFVMGEGSGTLILEDYEHAKARGAKIYCEVAGAGLSADAHHLTAPHPEGLGAANVMRFALEDAGLKPEDIDYINVHGTSTPLGDISEPLAIKSVFGDHAYNLNISSTKSMHGHLLGAAGAVESIACIFAIQEGRVPPTINLQNLDPKIDPDLNFTANVAQEREVNATLSNTFGFGGHNGSIILTKL